MRPRSRRIGLTASGVLDVGRLINRDKLARAKERREVRRQRILEEAGSIFSRMAYSEVTLDTIGQRADVERGVASMFFGSKEELFLIVFKDCLSEWFDALEHEVRNGAGTWGRTDLASFLARSVARRPTLTRYLSLLPVVLEQDIDAMVVFRFQRWRCDRMSEIGGRLEEMAPDLEVGDGCRLLNRTQLVAGGLEIAANPRGASAFDRNDPEFAGLWVDMESELACVIAGYLAITS